MTNSTRAFITLNFLLASVSAAFTQVPSYGSDHLLDVGCWNLEWFGSTGFGPSDEQLQFDNVKQVLNNTDIDIWGLSEMSNTTTYQQLLTELPQYGGVLATYSQTQKTALFYKKELFEVISGNHILTGSAFSYDFANRPPLEIALKTKSALAPDTVYVIVIHLKAYAEQESYDRRKAAVTILKNNYLDLYRKDKKTIVLGDWNDDLDESIFDGIETPFQLVLDDPDNYFFPTKALSDAGKKSYAFYNGSFLDHILVTAPLKADYQSGSAQVLDMMPNYIYQFSQNTSDHYPVLSSFRMEYLESLGIPGSATGQHLFAVSVDQEKVFVLGEWDGSVEIVAVDGARSAQFEKRGGLLEIPVHELPRGIYLVSLRMKHGVQTCMFVR